ncbi:hypothetical protein, unlikely [Trypanosoma brucei gambiense DAL972]|uniref:Uncharacterized protein n=1 Tax=Trypanosoma brucei gambiense (strain MHOM/CI/86/DAL972) TaxID=679716 RepID=C9ZTG6_TRYB9|nr:hypothetical protein, unlikely [Trypanosoma brucei gambiense DAL972]CBH12701.1 hypothetical protein, unlikely [Trypanosoma brucei gambiense DAL972]|eukprot:XP_011774981.1 hypothetical protein, unlikely [Trypanosoma brucei gambiense DAL972]
MSFSVPFSISDIGPGVGIGARMYTYIYIHIYIYIYVAMEDKLWTLNCFHFAPAFIYHRRLQFHLYFSIRSFLIANRRVCARPHVPVAHFLPFRAHVSNPVAKHLRLRHCDTFVLFCFVLCQTFFTLCILMPSFLLLSFSFRSFMI